MRTLCQCCFFLCCSTMSLQRFCTPSTVCQLLKRRNCWVKVSLHQGNMEKRREMKWSDTENGIGVWLWPLTLDTRIRWHTSFSSLVGCAWSMKFPLPWASKLIPGLLVKFICCQETEGRDKLAQHATLLCRFQTCPHSMWTKTLEQHSWSQAL